MADPVSQIFAQAQAGSAQGQGFGQFAAQGMQQGLARRRLDLEERQMEREEERQSMLLPLQQEAMRLNNINTGIEVQSRQLQAQAMTQQNAVLPQLYELQMQFQGSPAGYMDPTLINAYRQLTTQYPLAFVGGVGKDIRESIAAAPRINASLDAIVRANQRLQGTDARIESFDPATGRINLAPRQSNAPANLQEAAAITAQRRRVEAATDPATRAALQTELDDMLMQTTPSGMSIETTTPDGTRTVVSTGRTGAGDTKMPTSVVADAEAVANSAASLVQFGREIVNLAQPGNVGAAGNLKRLFGEVAGQFMDVEPGDEFDFAQATTFFRAGATRVLRSDSQITNDERKQIISDLPSKGWVEADETAREKARHAMRRVAESAKRQIRRAGVTLPTELLTVDDKDDIARMVREGKLSVQDAKSALMRKDLF